MGQTEYLFKIITVAVQILLHACRLRSACTRRNTDPDDEIELNESEHARTFAAAELGALERRPRPDELHQPRRRVHVGGGHLVPPPVQREHQPLNHRCRRRRRHGEGSCASPPPHAPCAADHLMITFNFTPRSASWSSRKAS